MKKLGNVTRYKLEPRCCKDQFVEGLLKLKDVCSDRMKERKKERRKMELIWDAVNYFKKKMETNKLALNEVLADYDRERSLEEKEWEEDYRDSIRMFDEDQYLEGRLI